MNKKLGEEFVVANLAFNIGGLGGPLADCNPNGSVWCTGNTQCDTNGSCFGTTCSGGSCSFKKMELQTRLVLDEERIQMLHKELSAVVAKFKG